MDYEDAIESTVSRKEAMQEIARHSLDWEDFIREEGDEETYPGKVVLDWLGY